jgi:hypothetical protein
VRFNIWRLLAPAIGPLAVLVALLGVFVWQPGAAQAAPVLDVDGQCTPGTLRPAAAALLTCTLTVTNTGDATAMNVAAQPSAPTAPCALASPIYIDRTVNGVPMAASGSRYNLGNIARQTSAQSVTRIAMINQGTGARGMKVTAFSLTNTSIQASDDFCWTVDPNASDPSMRMEVTKTPLNAGGCVTPPISEPAALEAKSHRAFEQRRNEHLAHILPGAEPQGFFGGCPPPPRPDYGGPVPISQPDPTPGTVEFEIVAKNLSGPAVLDVSVLDVETGSGAFVSADPPPTGMDFLGRPFWNAGTLDLDEEYRITASYGPQQPDRCLMAYDVAIVTSTVTGGGDEDYAAFPGSGQQVGNCEGGGGNSTLCWHYPPDDSGFGGPTVEQCNQEVCWIQFDFGGGEVFWEPHFGDCEEEVCQFFPPDGGEEGFGSSGPCDLPPCWVPHGPADSFHYDQSGCGAETCLHTSPDENTSIYQGCDFPVCWTMPPGSPTWEARFFEECELEDPCWFMPPGKGEPVVNDCALELTDVCWSTDFFGGEEGVATPTDFDGPVLLNSTDFYFTLPCDFTFCEFTAPDGVTTANASCESEICWSQSPEGNWQNTFSCDAGFCWFTPAGGGNSFLEDCGIELCFLPAPDGAIDAVLYFEQSIFFYVPPPLPIDCGFTEELCWSAPPPEKGAFMAVISECADAPLCFGAPPNDTADWPVPCGTTFCWQSWPATFPDPDDRGISPDQLVNGPCPPEDPGKTGQAGTSAVAVEEEATSAPATLEESQSSVEQLPEPSLSKQPASFVQGDSEAVDAEPSSGSEPVEIYRPDIVDYDGDGCDNLHERGPAALAGGLRDPDNVWDFFDTPGAGNAREGAISAADVARVVQRFGRNGDNGLDPLSPPGAPPAYHTAFDRLPDGTGANGSITAQDVAVIVNQFGHSCL